MRPCLSLGLFLLTTSAAWAGGGGDCDCARRVGLCQAEATSDGARIAFTSQTDQCSRIAFSIGGEPAAITIRRGRGVAALPAPTEPGEVQVEACYVCDVASSR